jgi:preprotein translocase subunit SecD
MFALPNAFYGRVEGITTPWRRSRLGATPEREAAAGAWPDWMPSSLVNLGLDLRGGAHLLAEVQVSDVYADRMDALWPEVRDALRDERGTVGTIRRSRRRPTSCASGSPSPPACPRDGGRAGTCLAGRRSPGIGASDIVVAGAGDEITVRLSDEEMRATDDRTIQQSLEIIRRRVDEVGTREPTIQRQGEDRILIQVPGIGSAAELKALIGTTARLTFNPVVGTTTIRRASTGRPQRRLSVDGRGGASSTSSSPRPSSGRGTDRRPADLRPERASCGQFPLQPLGRAQVRRLHRANIGSPFAIVLDDEVISAPVIQSHIPAVRASSPGASRSRNRPSSPCSCAPGRCRRN